jgi:drug/metabolite transporter (DMT)-like permease
VVLAVLLLGEVVRIYRWTAVVIGLIGVLIIIADFVTPGANQPERSFVGALFGLGGALFGALAAIQIRRMIETEPAATIVVYFSVFAALVSLMTLPFGWVMPTPGDALIFVSIGIFGGLGQVLMTQSFRYADASVLAPFDYVTMLWAILISFFVFDYLPTPLMLAGTAIVIGSGLFVLYREHRLGIVPKARPAQPPPPPLT